MSKQARGEGMKRWLILAMALWLPAAAVRSALAEGGYTQTRYPIVLVHGLFGFGSINGFDYFYRVPESLRKDGAQVYVAEVDPVNTSAARGEQLLTQVQDILAISGAEKVNLIGHSQGAPTARYVAAVRPDLVASVTSVGGVNQGSAVADRLLALAGADSPWRAAALSALAALSGQSWGLSQLTLTLNDLSTASSARFNTLYPGGVPRTPCAEGDYVANGVRYYSWGGTAVVTNLLDPADLPLVVLSRAIDGPSDGLVARCSSHLGQVIRDDYKMNHANEINQIVGLVSAFEVNPLSVYRQQANRLKLAGL
jgi:triacylglycerol lipase